MSPRVTFIRQASVNGVERQAMAIDWAHKVAHYVDGRFGFSNIRVGIEVYGNAGRITWLGDQNSLESLADGTLAMLVDEDYKRLLGEAAGLFLPGSVEDKVVVGLAERQAL